MFRPEIVIVGKRIDTIIINLILVFIYSKLIFSVAINMKIIKINYKLDKV